jgi:hypothetical protein
MYFSEHSFTSATYTYVSEVIMSLMKRFKSIWPQNSWDDSTHIYVYIPLQVLVKVCGINLKNRPHDPQKQIIAWYRNENEINPTLAPLLR